MSRKELTEEHKKQLDNILHSYDNIDIAKGIFGLFKEKRWSNNLGIELLKLVDKFYND